MIYYIINQSIYYVSNLELENYLIFRKVKVIYLVCQHEVGLSGTYECDVQYLILKTVKCSTGHLRM